MYLPVLAVCLALASGVSAHEEHGGAHSTQVRRSAGVSPELPIYPLAASEPSSEFTVDDEETVDSSRRLRRCGRRGGVCPKGSCCSSSGYCGFSTEHCMAPDCQYEYGSGCDALKRPYGEDTSRFPRVGMGDVPYGVTTIHQCVIPNTVALTYDDGPNIYTSDLLDILDSFDAKATFFVTAINSNKGQIDYPDYPWADILRRMYASGHQIASHTWSHQDLDRMPSNLRRDQMIKNEIVLVNVLGGFPTYMRPPYSRCSLESGCLEDMNDLGYHVAFFDVDTDDYNNDSPDQIQRSKDIFDDHIAMQQGTGKPMLVISHDVHEQTVYNLTTHMLFSLYDADYVPVTLGECLGDSPYNWYRWPGDYLYNDPVEANSKNVSTDGTCGSEYTCTGSAFGDCCSGNGTCGNESEHCGKGCQGSSGLCHFETVDTGEDGKIYDGEYEEYEGYEEYNEHDDYIYEDSGDEHTDEDEDDSNE